MKIAQKPSPGVRSCALTDPMPHPLRTNDGRRRVLVVEDQLLTALDIVDMVEELGGTVVGTATSAAEAVAMAEAERPDLVLMDVWLDGEVDGVEAAYSIRERLGTRVIFITGNAEPSTVERIRHFGNAPMLLKPIDIGGLRDAVRRVVVRLGTLLAVLPTAFLEFG